MIADGRDLESAAPRAVDVASFPGSRSAPPCSASICSATRCATRSIHARYAPRFRAAPAWRTSRAHDHRPPELRILSFDVEALREREFPWAARGEAIYLNNATTGPLPERTLARAARVRRAARRAVSPVRRAPVRDARARPRAHRATDRRRARRRSGSRRTRRYGINLAAFGLPLGAGDVVLTPDREFPANVYPWMQLAEQRGVEYRRLPTCDGAVDEDALRRELEDPAVRAVSVSWVGFATGYTVDLAALGRACRERGVYFVVDAIQGLGPLTLDVRACHIDILACGAQKWLLSPWGTGFVYVRRELIAAARAERRELDGGEGQRRFPRLIDYDLTWRDDARRFEFITLPVSGFRRHEREPRADSRARTRARSPTTSPSSPTHRALGREPARRRARDAVGPAPSRRHRLAPHA